MSFFPIIKGEWRHSSFGNDVLHVFKVFPHVHHENMITVKYYKKGKLYDTHDGDIEMSKQEFYTVFVPALNTDTMIRINGARLPGKWTCSPGDKAKLMAKVESEMVKDHERNHPPPKPEESFVIREEDWKKQMADYTSGAPPPPTDYWGADEHWTPEQLRFQAESEARGFRFGGKRRHHKKRKSQKKRKSHKRSGKSRRH